MPEMDGFELIQEIRSRKIYTPIIIISGREEEHNKILALGLGADDYLTKPFSIHLLHSKLKALIRRNNRYQQEEKIELVVGPFSLDKNTLEISKNGEVLPLTSKETKLLRMFLEHPNQVFTKEQLYAAVWNELVVDDNTIMVYVKRLRKKIEVDPKKPVYLVTVWGIGPDTFFFWNFLQWICGCECKNIYHMCIFREYGYSNLEYTYQSILSQTRVSRSKKR